MFSSNFKFKLIHNIKLDGNDRRADYVLTRRCKGGETFEFYVEMACNGKLKRVICFLFDYFEPDLLIINFIYCRHVR
jgi:hypothetical protein